LHSFVEENEENQWSNVDLKTTKTAKPILLKVRYEKNIDYEGSSIKEKPKPEKTKKKTVSKKGS